MKDVELALAVDRARANWGAGDPMRYYRDVIVEDDGTVSAWDDIAGQYSIHHDLSETEQAEARRLAGLVRSGTHYSAGGFVFALKNGGVL